MATWSANHQSLTWAELFGQGKRSWRLYGVGTRDLSVQVTGISRKWDAEQALRGWSASEIARKWSAYFAKSN